jgi:hypothetical protein
MVNIAAEKDCTPARLLDKKRKAAKKKEALICKHEVHS